MTNEMFTSCSFNQLGADYLVFYDFETIVYVTYTFLNTYVSIVPFRVITDTALYDLPLCLISPEKSHLLNTEKGKWVTHFN